MSIPASVRSYFEGRINLKKRVLLIQLDAHGQVGEIDHYGGNWALEGLQTGAKLPDVLTALVESSEGDQPQMYKFVQLLDNEYAEIHTLPGEPFTYIILVDVSKDQEMERMLRQRANEISLLLEQQAQLSKTLEKLNTELESKKAEADQARNLAQKANRAKSNFLANMSHEIRTPISTIIGMTTLLLDEKLTARGREFAGTIQKSGKLLLTLIEGILDFSKIESDKLEINTSTFDIRQCIDEALDLFREEAAAKNIKLVTEIGDAPESAVFDAPHLRQVLVNLLSNAIKFTDKGSITLHAYSKAGEDGARKLGFSVTDTGIGIPADRLDIVFEPFDQAESGIRSKYGGTGLGLSICKRLVELMGGEIWIKSTEGEGTAIGFEFPVQADEGKGAVRASDKKKRVHKPPFIRNLGEKLPLRILVAEDNTINRLVLCLLLDKMGYKADEVADGHEAVAAVGRKEYDLVFMDVQMPTMSGIEATRRIRKAGSRGEGIRIVGLTADATLEVRDKCLEAGMNDFVTKPVSIQELESALKGTAA